MNTASTRETRLHTLEKAYIVTAVWGYNGENDILGVFSSLDGARNFIRHGYRVKRHIVEIWAEGVPIDPKGYHPDKHEHEILFDAAQVHKLMEDQSYDRLFEAMED